ncbi:DUF1127 domain-containing protein [Thalassovita sp.]|uniref:DUF1127 domain-containing protein n=1 Tax=Thalassovita sp. TaxID=1979401 RepID=UPI003B5B7D64
MFTLISSHRATLPRASRPSLMARVLGALSLHRQRQRLAQLDDAMLRDIGLTRAQANKEAARPVWDAPTHWQG